MVVVNLTRDKVWVRDGVVPDYPSQAAPKFDIAAMGVGHSGSAQQASGLPGAVDSQRRDFAGRLLPEGLQAGIDSVLADHQASLHPRRTSARWLVVRWANPPQPRSPERMVRRASAHEEVGLPQSSIPIALLFFNVGVEIGQLLFVGAVLAVITVGRRAGQRVRVPQPAWLWRIAPYAIGGLASFWLVERVATF